MAQQPARQARRLRVVRPRPEEVPLLDLTEGVRLYAELLDQSRLLQDTVADMRQRLLRAMEQAGINEFQAHELQAVRQIRHLPSRLNAQEAESILQREGRLKEAQRIVLDIEKAREVIDELYQQGLITDEELPYSEPREVEALIVRNAPEPD